MKLSNIFVIILFTLFIVTSLYLLFANTSIGGLGLIFIKNNSTLTSNNSSIINPTVINSTNDTLKVPPNDFVINNINWSLYPNLQKGYISVAEISGPNDVVSHQFIEVQIHTEVINSDNKTEILKQLDNVAREARFIYGNNSGINVYGDKNGVPYYFSSMIPYDDTIY
jgi:hypothetical protein